MKNKKIVKKVFQEKINKDKNYKEIIQNINNTKLDKKAYWKPAYICTILLISCSLLFIGSKSNLLKSLYNGTPPDVININKAIQKTFTTHDTTNPQYDVADDLKKYSENPPTFFKNLELPEDFAEDFTTKIVFKEKRIFNNYEYLFQSVDGTRRVIISYSEENKPLNIYYSSTELLSRINGTKLIIYYGYGKYTSEFMYKDTNYLVETEKMSENELINLLKSIIK